MKASEEGNRVLARQSVRIFLVLILASLVGSAVRAEEWPLSKDDITLLLIGGSKTDKMLELIERRGLDFKMDPDLAKRFHDLGASEEVIEALQRASAKRAERPAGAAASSPPISSGQTTQATAPGQRTSSVEEKVKQELSQNDPLVADETGESPPGQGTVASAAKAKPAASTSKAVDLSNPSPDEIQRIIQEFARKEKLFKEARDNYTFHQINKVEELGLDDEVVGTYRQDWDILFDDTGKRLEQVTYAPVSSLQRISVTKEDLDAMRNIQPFVLTSDELPEYDVKYMGHVKVDFLTTYVFSIRPKEIKKGRQYFKGVIWVDDRDLQIVKSEGKSVPELKTKSGENLFPRFTTYREQIDGKYWFPTYTMADDTLYFSGGPVHMKQVIRYTDYKQFKSKVRILSATPTSESGRIPENPPPKK